MLRGDRMLPDGLSQRALKQPPTASVLVTVGHAVELLDGVDPEVLSNRMRRVSALGLLAKPLLDTRELYGA
jgi:hypothetical protein